MAARKKSASKKKAAKKAAAKAEEVVVEEEATVEVSRPLSKKEAWALTGKDKAKAAQLMEESRSAE